MGDDVCGEIACNIVAHINREWSAANMEVPARVLAK